MEAPVYYKDKWLLLTVWNIPWSLPLFFPVMVGPRAYNTIQISVSESELWMYSRDPGIQGKDCLDFKRSYSGKAA